MEEGTIETFDRKVYNMKDVDKTAEKNKTQRANKADKKKDAAKELQRLQKENKKLSANLAQSRMPFLEDKRGTEEEIDAESVQLFTTTDATPRKQRFAAPVDRRQSRAAFGRTLASGLGIKDRLGETRSEKELKINFIDKNNNFSGNKRTWDQFTQDQPIVEGDDGDWHYAEEEENCQENCPGIDAQAAEVGSGQMDEDQDVYAHSA